MTSPIEALNARMIGIVESVAPDQITVLLDLEAPRSTAFSQGQPTSFPKINSFVLIPGTAGAVVGVITWLGIEHSSYPKRQGLKDFGLLDLPFPLRKMSISPVGMLLSEENQENETWVLERGIRSFPSVGDTVILPTKQQTIAIVTGSEGKDHVLLGTCPTAYDTEIKIDPNILFGRHLAVLGNTGSGKSCTVAELIHASLEAAKRTFVSDKKHPNARFIILDPNGEYSRCFKEARVFQVQLSGSKSENTKQFKLPAWMWNSHEWASILQASPKVQRPLLQQALRGLRSGVSKPNSSPNSPLLNITSNLKSKRSIFSKYQATGTEDWQTTTNVVQNLKTLKSDLEKNKSGLGENDAKYLEEILHKLDDLLNNRLDKSASYFAGHEIKNLIEKIDCFLNSENVTPIINKSHTINEDLPIHFPLNELQKHIEVISTQSTNNDQYVASLLMRIEAIVKDTRMKNVIESDITLGEWLTDYIGDNNAQHGTVAVIDLSLVSADILHLMVAVAARLILEALQRYRIANGKNLPTVLVLEEAHTFVARHFPKSEEEITPATMCRKTFERIAREGRKFGLGLVLSSQRPSDLSETALSQCNSFILHRMTNNNDQELVARLVPDNARGLLRELPSLPTRHCLLLGLASKIPVLMQVRNLEKSERPHSENPDFWEVWTGQSDRTINWEEIAKDWSRVESSSP